MDAGRVYYRNVSFSFDFCLQRIPTNSFSATGVQACSYPGTAIAGRMSSVKFYYSIGESITFTCDAGLELKGARMLKCLRSGKWSNAIPTCISTEPPTNNK